ncbi:MAG: EAL domain-containing protein [Gemmatimonadaceae bacterium]|nr:EAL domain-containing protein [Gloeobacterales cyanobacterium ES-bin-141]
MPNQIEENLFVGTEVLLQEALLHDRLELWFQPVYRTVDGKVMHNEVLLRMRDREGELIMPALFIPVALRSGLMHQIDYRVLEKAIAQLAQEPSLCLSVNLSSECLNDPGFARNVKERLQVANIQADRLCFELSEQDVLKHFGAAQMLIKDLKGIGCRFALDDFGFDISRCEYLRDLPVDMIKIDGKFIRGLKTDPLYRVLVSAMNDIAHAFGKRTLAESVEDTETLKILQSLGVDYLQGYYLKRPTNITTSTTRFKFPLRIMTFLVGLYVLKSALGIDLSEEHHIWELPVLLLRAVFPSL